MTSIKPDIWMVRSPDNESVDDGECDREGVGGLSSDEPEVHKSDSHATSGTVGTGISGS